jgi:hypothetical protein
LDGDQAAISEGTGNPNQVFLDNFIGTSNLLTNLAPSLNELIELYDKKKALVETLEKTIKTHRSVKSPVSQKAN